MNAIRGILSGISISHEHASISDLEAAGVESQKRGVEQLLRQSTVDEAFVLQTCNRVEAYVVGDDCNAVRALEGFTEDVPDDAIVLLDHEEGLHHLIRVACGLESVILGENQILGQMREAYQDASAVGAIGSVLEAGLIKAIHVGERARTETAINEGTLSLASAGVRIAVEERDIDGATGLVIGAGEMGKLAAEALSEYVGYLYVANRTLPHAEHVANSVPVEAEVVSLDSLATPASRAEIVVSATSSPKPVITTDTLADAGDTFVVDLAQPRDVAPDVDALSNCHVCDLDVLESRTHETRADRREAAICVESMVEEEFDRLLTQYKRQRADSVIATMYESASEIKERELDTATTKLDLDADQEEVVESMADAVVSRLLAAPTRSLRDAAERDDWSTLHSALKLFDPELESGQFGDDDHPPSEVELLAGRMSAVVDGEVPRTTREESGSDTRSQYSDSD